ncbi:hypothetical protein BGZ83_004311, partial [Gryganskiella cystojenkinii]
MKVATTFTCNFCKSDGHDKLNCPVRLAQVCTICRFPGHLAPRCAELGSRDRAMAAKKGLGPILPNRPTNTSEAPRPNNNNNMNNNNNNNAAAEEIEITEEELAVIPPIGEEEEGEKVPESPIIPSRESSAEPISSSSTFTSPINYSDISNNSNPFITQAFTPEGSAYARDSMDEDVNMTGASSSSISNSLAPSQRHSSSSPAGSFVQSVGSKSSNTGVIGRGFRAVRTAFTNITGSAPTQSPRKAHRGKKAPSITSNASV